MSEKKPEDLWFYDIVRQQRDIHINVNPDVNLGVTKLWIDVLMRDGDQILGVVGTGLDLDVLVPISSFSGILLVYGLTLLVALALFNFVLNRQVLRPLRKLECAMQAVEQGDLSVVVEAPQETAEGPGEIARLIMYFRRMARAQWEARQDLESKVQERTEALERLSKTDALTELLNRRGMTERLQAEISRTHREKTHLGLLWLDIGLFKQINDQYGHAMGDEALRRVAQRIHDMLRPYDSVARWGGDEFLVLTQASGAHDVHTLGERIRAAIEETARLHGPHGEPIRLTVSVGGYFAEISEGMESMLQHADQALYLAKTAGRNVFRSYPEG